MILWNETHQKKISINLIIIQIKQIWKFQNDQFSIWFYSETIFEVFFNNLHEIFKIFENDSWSTHLIFQSCMNKKIIKFEKIFKKSDIFTNIKMNLIKETSFLLQTTMIVSDWFKISWFQYQFQNQLKSTILISELILKLISELISSISIL